MENKAPLAQASTAVNNDNRPPIKPARSASVDDGNTVEQIKWYRTPQFNVGVGIVCIAAVCYGAWTALQVLA